VNTAGPQGDGLADSPPADAPRRLLTRDFALLLLVALVGAVVMGLHIRDDTKLSPIDELQHVDYLAKASDLHIPRVGETDGALARHEAACRGIEAPYTPPPCAQSSAAPDGAFPENAADTAASDPPLYYVTTGLAARALKAVLHMDSLVTAARLAGIAWLVAALVLLWLLTAEMGVGSTARTAVGILLVTTPAIVHAHATVTSDATLLLGGAAALYAALLWERRRLHGAVLLAIAALCGLAKIPCLLAIGAAALYLLVRALRQPGGAEPRRTPAELVRMAVLSTGLAVGVTLLWLLVAHVRAVPGAPTPPSTAVFRATHLRLDQVAAQAGAFLSPLAAPPILAPLASAFTLAILSVSNLLVLSGTFGSALLAAARTRLEAAAIAAGALMLVGGPAFVVAIYVSDHSILPAIPHRYGLALIPAAAVCLAALLAKAWARWGAALFAAVAGLYTIAHLAAR